MKRESNFSTMTKSQMNEEKKSERKRKTTSLSLRRTMTMYMCPREDVSADLHANIKYITLILIGKLQFNN